MENKTVDTVPRSETCRRFERFPLYSKLHFIPIDDGGTRLYEETVIVLSKDMSVAGIGFSHDIPLLHGRGVIAHSNAQAGQLAVEVEIMWTKQTPLGMYESGCRFIRTVAGHRIFCEPK